jgi:hypothetical protein
VKSSDILKQKYFATGINNEELLHVSTLIVDSIDGIRRSRLLSDAKTLRTSLVERALGIVVESSVLDLKLAFGMIWRCRQTLARQPSYRSCVEK